MMGGLGLGVLISPTVNAARLTNLSVLMAVRLLPRYTRQMSFDFRKTSGPRISNFELETSDLTLPIANVDRITNSAV